MSDSKQLKAWATKSVEVEVGASQQPRKTKGLEIDCRDNATFSKRCFVKGGGLGHDRSELACMSE